MGQGTADPPTPLGIGQVAHRRQVSPASRNGPELAADDDPVPGLSRFASGDGDVTRISNLGASGGDGADRQ